MVYAVIDTNILVSSRISKNPLAATVKVVANVFQNRIIPVFNEEILSEYYEVLHRPKFRISEEQINAILEYIKKCGVHSERMLVLNLGHSPLYRHFCKCLYIELLKFRLLFNYWHIANPILSGRILKKSLQPLNILVKNLPRYSHADRPCIFTVLMML